MEGLPGRGDPDQWEISVTRVCRNSRGHFKLVEDRNENGMINMKLQSTGGSKISTLKTKRKIIIFIFQSPSEQKTKRVFTESASDVTAGKQCIS